MNVDVATIGVDVDSSRWDSIMLVFLSFYLYQLMIAQSTYEWKCCITSDRPPDWLTGMFR